jgi:SAM-dependent methyltransferase
MRLGKDIRFTLFVASLRQNMMAYVLITFLLIIDHVAIHAYISRPNPTSKRLNYSHALFWGASTRQVKDFSRSSRCIIDHCDVITNLRSSNDPNNNDAATLSRRDMIYSAVKIPVFTVALYAYGRVLFNFLSTPSIATLFSGGAPIYPIQHEQRMAKMIQIAVDAASNTSTSTKTFRVLEVGIGTEARLIRRGLYNDAIHKLSDENNIRRLEITGLDVQVPTKDNVVSDMNKMIQLLTKKENIDVSLGVVQSSITEPLEQFPDGYFDSILFCFTLCSVSDPTLALRTIKRLLRPNGGTMAYLEHVAVDIGDTDHQLLSYEQQLFDPLQQLLADHCHLHRNTESTMDMVLSIDHTTPLKYHTLHRERFYIDQMWPVSCQACGVIQSS